MKIKPLFDRVIALPIAENKTTQSGISLQPYQDSSVKKAKVIAIGTGTFEEGVFQEMKVSIGDTIYYEEHTVANMFICNTQHILIKQTDILAVEKE